MNSGCLSDIERVSGANREIEHRCSDAIDVIISGKAREAWRLWSDGDIEHRGRIRDLSDTQLNQRERKSQSKTEVKERGRHDTMRWISE